MKTYQLTPIEAANAKSLSLRALHALEIRNLLQLRQSGRSKRAEMKILEHIKTQIRWLNMLSSDELFNISQKASQIPPIFHKYVEFFYRLRTGRIFGHHLENLSPSLLKTGHVTDLFLANESGRVELFDYESQEQFENPGVPVLESIKIVQPQFKLSQKILDQITEQIKVKVEG